MQLSLYDLMDQAGLAVTPPTAGNAPARRRPPRLAHLDRIDAKLAGDPPPLTPAQIAEAEAQLSAAFRRPIKVEE